MSKIDELKLVWLREAYAAENVRRDAIFETVSVPLSCLTAIGAVQAFWIAGFAAHVPRFLDLGRKSDGVAALAVFRGFANAITIRAPEWLEITLGIVLSLGVMGLGVIFIIISSRHLMQVASGNRYALAASPGDFRNYVKAIESAAIANGVPEEDLLDAINKYLIDELASAGEFNVTANEMRLIARKSCFDHMFRGAAATLIGLSCLALAVLSVSISG